MTGSEGLSFAERVDSIETVADVADNKWIVIVFTEIRDPSTNDNDTLALELIWLATGVTEILLLTKFKGSIVTPQLASAHAHKKVMFVAFEEVSELPLASRINFSPNRTFCTSPPEIIGTNSEGRIVTDTRADEVAVDDARETTTTTTSYTDLGSKL
jgi:hypothetical protein